MLGVMIEIDDEKLREYALYPAVDTSETKVYFVQGSKIVGQGSVRTRYEGHITVMPDAETTANFFADDYALPLLGDVANLRYSPYDGAPMPGFTDEPENRHKDTIVVGKMYFDIGITPERFAHIEGARRPLDDNTPT
jgi:hypothetical protein